MSRSREECGKIVYDTLGEEIVAPFENGTASTTALGFSDGIESNLKAAGVTRDELERHGFLTTEVGDDIDDSLHVNEIIKAKKEFQPGPEIK